MAKKKNEAVELAEKLVRVLESQRGLGGDAYPLALQRLVELIDPHAPWTNVEKAVKSKPFTERACVAQRGSPAALVALGDDLERLATSPRVLELALETACTLEKPALPLRSVAAKVDPRLRKAFEETVSRQVREHTLPSAVGCQVVKNKPLLYLQRMPPPKEPDVALGENLLRVLKTQRGLGDEAYPLSLRRLVELTDPAAPPALLQQALGKEPFKSGAVLALKKHPDTPVALAEDGHRLLVCGPLFVLLLNQLRKETEQAFPLSRLKTKLPANLKQPFEQTVTRQLALGVLAPGIGWLWVGKKPLFLLLDDLHGSSTPHVTSPAKPAAIDEPPDFAALFDTAFDRLDREAGGHNFLNLVELRQAVPLPREAFDQGLHQLRRAGRYTLSAAEGRHGLRAEEREAGIHENGMLLLYVSRRVL